MNIVAYAAKAWRFSTWRTAGVCPLTSPPLHAGSLNTEQLIADVVYIRLHGVKGQPYLYGDPGFATALTTDQVVETDFSGSLVFMEGCYGSDFADAFLAGGARVVIGSAQPTWGRRLLMGPSSVVGRAWLQHMAEGAAAYEALDAAVRKVKQPYSQGWSVQGQGDARL